MGWSTIITSVIGINQEKKSTFFIQIACYLKEKAQKMWEGVEGPPVSLHSEKSARAHFQKYSWVSWYLHNKIIINIEWKFVLWSLMYWDETGCLQRWVQCCRLDLTRGGWAGLKGTLLRQLSPRMQNSNYPNKAKALILTILFIAAHSFNQKLSSCTLQSKLSLF